MIRIPALAGIACVMLCAPTVNAATVTYVASMDSAQENNPLNNSPGTGTATVVIDFDLLTMHVDAMFSGLQGTTSAAHIHCCEVPPTAAPVATPTPTFPGFPLGVTAGSYSMDFTLAEMFNATYIANNGGTAGSAFVAFTNGLNAGQAYFNIHTSTFSGGEIRGQLTAVPLPGALPLMLSGLLAGLARLGRRRR